MTWDGVVLHWMASNGIGWHGIASDGMVLHRMASDSMRWHGIASDGMVLHRMALNGIGGMRWHQMA